MIKAIIFDCFGVLTSDGWLPFKDKHFGNDTAKNEEATTLNALANSGKIPYTQFLTAVAQLASVSLSELDMEMHRSVPSEPVLRFIEELKNHFKIGMLSNISGDWLHELFTEEQISLFDAIALSYETGYAKPDSRAYEVIMERLGCTAEECIYIDDQLRFVDPANDAGMHAIQFKDFEQMKEDINQLLKVADTDK